jgi:acetylornithine deacetylase/succinyl-diaminopimelate desuccinylase-like protein
MVVLARITEGFVMSEAVNIYQRPVELLQNLLRFDTTNPPGNEAACIAYINDLLKSCGIETILLEKAAGRPNLIARLKGVGNATPLLLQGHVDVVTTLGQEWSHAPFAGEIADGFVWGRGTLDMKSGVAMMLAAFMRAKVENLELDGDVILCILSDEEAGGEFGAKFLVTEHAELFKDVRYALGEFGGFTLVIGGKRFYPIMVAEKQICWLKATVHGPAGHGSMPIQGGASAKLGQMLTKLDKQRLPVHITESAKYMFGILADNLNMPASFLIRQLLNPAMTDRILDLMGAQGRLFDPLLHNTISPTIFRGGDKINVIPSSISVEFDGRLLPTIRAETMLAEVRALLGKDVEVELLHHDTNDKEADMGLFATLAGILREADPTGIPAPLLLSAVTDGRFFSRLGIQTYGFLPMQLAPDFNFSQTIHAANERIPVEALGFGTNAIYQALQRFGKM